MNKGLQLPSSRKKGGEGIIKKSGPKGKLVIIGGAEDKEGPCLILREFLKLAGGSDARIVILAAATELPLEVGSRYQEVFARLGCSRIKILPVPDRLTANGSYSIRMMQGATGVFFTGGDQLRITSILGGTEMLTLMQERFRRGIIIAGTSAGASVMSSTMIVEGDNEHSPQLNTVKMAPGMGLISGVVIDQHFAQRGRIGRLLSALAQNPAVLGLGIDEDTAIIVERGYFRVWGRQTVTVLDGSRIIHTNASMMESNQFLALTNVTTHILPSGYRYDLVERKPVLP